MIDTLRLTAEDALGLLERARGLVGRAPRRVRGGRRRARRRAPRVSPPRRVRRGQRRPDRPQGRDLDEGRRDDGRLEDPRRLRAGLRLDGGGALQGGGHAADRQDEHRRVRDGLVDRELRLRAVAQPVGPDPRPRRLGRRHRSGRLRRARALGARLRHGRLDQAAVGALRQRRPAADLRHRLALRHRRLRVEPRPDRAGREDGARRRAALLDHRRPRRATTRPRSSFPRRSSCPRRESLDGLRIGIPKQIWDLPGIEPGVRASFEAAIETARSLGAEIGECDLPLSFDYGMACYYLIAPAEASSNLARYDGVRYGPRVEAPTYREMVERTRDAGLRRRAEAADHARHLRALGRLLRRVLRPGAAGADAADPRAPRCARALRRDRDADVADGGVPDRRQGRRPARDVRLRRDDDSLLPRGPAGAQHPVRASPRACRSGCS